MVTATCGAFNMWHLDGTWHIIRANFISLLSACVFARERRVLLDVFKVFGENLFEGKGIDVFKATASQHANMRGADPFMKNTDVAESIKFLIKNLICMLRSLTWVCVRRHPLPTYIMFRIQAVNLINYFGIAPNAWPQIHMFCPTYIVNAQTKKQQVPKNSLPKLCLRVIVTVLHKTKKLIIKLSASKRGLWLKS